MPGSQIFIRNIGAPANASYVTIGTNGVLSAERTLAGTSNQVVVTDNTTNVTLSLPQSIATSSAVQFGTLGIGGAIQRSGPFEVKGASAASLTAGTADAIISHAGAFNGLALINTTFSTDADNGFRVRQLNTGNTLLQTGQGSLLTSTVGLTQTFDQASNAFSWKWGSGNEGRVAFFRGTNQTRIDVFGQVIPTGHAQGDNYFNSVYKFSVEDASGNTGSAYEFGAEGNWTTGGGFTGNNNRIYLWNHITNTNVWMYQHQDPYVFNFGDSTSGAGVGVQAYGRALDTEADGSWMAGNFLGFLTKNDANTRTFSGVTIQPTLNAGASNTTTTFNVLNVDTTNTATTGVTTNLANFSYGGVQRAVINSDGQFTLNKDSAGTIAILNAYANATGVSSIRMRRARGTSVTPLRVQSSDGLTAIQMQGYYAVDNTTTATLGSITGALRFYSLENFTSTGQGTGFAIDITSQGSTTSAQMFDLSAKGVTIGSVGISRSTTNPTNALTLPDGTAPAGTLTNAVQLYSGSGKLKSADAAGTIGHVLSVSAVNTVTPTLQNRTLTVDIGGTTYYITAKTTND